MKMYLVGGAVRDELLKQPVKDRDWVVVGATEQQMKQQGYQAIGRDFPVFLHPDSREEYALARTERKSGHGYTGFEFHAAQDVTLEEDLARRDLTINAIAQDQEGNLTDPFGGLQDLNDKVLRHVSPAFSEDPLRVLRVARFAARYHPLGFRIASDTLELMRAMSASGELSHLVAERVWQETQRALEESNADIYFSTLAGCGALQVVLPEIHQAIERLQQFPLQALQLAQQEEFTNPERFACIALQTLHAEPRECAQLEILASRLRLPQEYRSLAQLLNLYLPDYQRRPLQATSIWRLLEQLDGLRRPDRLTRFLHCAELISRLMAQPTLDSEAVIRLLDGARQLDSAPLIASGIKGKALGDALREQRLELTARHLPLLAVPDAAPHNAGDTP